MSSVPTSVNAQALEDLPGFHIRRLQQIAVAIFLEETEPYGITPVQFAALSAIHREPGLDQRTLAGRIGYDTSTLGSVIDRLEARGLVLRSNSPTDRRVRLLHVTPEGQHMLSQLVPNVQQAQEKMLAPLAEEQRDIFMGMIRQLVEANNVLSRAPSQS